MKIKDSAFMQLAIALLLMALPIFLSGQVNNDAYVIQYEYYNNGKKSNRTNKIVYKDGVTCLPESGDKTHEFINYNTKEVVQTLVDNGKIYKYVQALSELPKSIDNKIPTDKVILGYDCEYAKFSYFSNTIEVWYTEQATAKGSPNIMYVPTDKALVLRMVVNGNRETLASEISPLARDIVLTCDVAKATAVSKAELEELKINARFIKLPIFTNEVVNFDPSIPIPDRYNLEFDSIYRMSKGSVILKKIRLTEEMKKCGSVFAQLHCRSNGDAYDRTGSVFIIPDTKGTTMLDAFTKGVDVLPVFTDNNDRKYQGIRKESDYVPPVEIMRFFTSFGAQHFNDKRVINNYDWAEDVRYKQDITPVFPLVDEMWIGVFVGNYDSGGHNVSLDLDFYPGWGDNEEEEKFVEPLFSTVNIMEMSGQNYGRFFRTDTLMVEFSIPEDVEEAQLLYTPTGHGGWGGGDEFNPKLNRILLDGNEVFRVIPWRTDCATYRYSNPASGNFRNGLSSSDLSRSNWCPATLTPPYIIPFSSIAPGKHTLQVVIDQGEDEGGSFSAWAVTGVLVATKK